MSNSVEYCGVVYDDRFNWHTYLTDVLAGSTYRGLELDRHLGLSLPDALGALSEALQGTVMAVGLADAALQIVERGDEHNIEVIRSIPWVKAPNAFARMLELVERKPRTLSHRWVASLYEKMFRLEPTDSHLLASFEIDASAPSGRDLLETAALYNPTWLAEQLPSLRPPPDVKMYQWLRWIAPEARDRLLTAIARLGSTYVESLVSQVAALPHETDAYKTLLPALNAHAAFAGRI